MSVVRTVSSNKGDSFTAAALCFLLAKGNHDMAVVHAERFRGSMPEVPSYLEKAAITPGTLTDLNWGWPLTGYGSMVADFIAFERQQSALGRLTAARRVPLRERLAIETLAATTSWRSEASGPKPISAMAFTNATLEPYTLQTTIVVSDELLRASNALAALKQALICSLVTYQDASLLDLSRAATTDAPASVTHGGATVTPSGSSALLVKTDLKTACIAVCNAVGEPVALVILMNALTAAKLGLMSDTNGAPAFPNISAVTGGSIGGIPVVITAGARSTGSPAVDAIIVMDQSQLLLADGEDIRLSIADQATIQMDSAPAEPGDASTVLVSLWQRNLVGLRAERTINWSMARANAVATLTVTF